MAQNSIPAYSAMAQLQQQLQQQGTGTLQNQMIIQAQANQQTAGNPQWGIPVMQQGIQQLQGTTTSLMINRDDILDTLLGPFPCVKIRGLPFEASYQDLMAFFQGLPMVDCVYNKRSDGRLSGEAYVVFASQTDTQLAIQRDRGSMGHRYLEVFQARRSEYYQAISGSTGSIGAGGGFGDDRGSRFSKFTGAAPASTLTEHTGYLRLRGLPFSCRKEDIIDFFRGIRYEEDSIEFVRRADGRMTGECYIKFPTIEDAKKGMLKDKCMLGNRYVEVFISAVDEYSRATGRL